MFLSRPPDGVVGGAFEIEDWTTSDGGATWTSRRITSGSAANNVRPILPWPVHGQTNPRRMIFWMHGRYVHYTNYSTGIKYSFLDPTVSIAFGNEGRGQVRIELSAWGAAGFDPLGRKVDRAAVFPLRGIHAESGEAGSGRK